MRAFLQATTNHLCPVYRGTGFLSDWMQGRVLDSSHVAAMEPKLQVRIGIHSGEVVAGVIGKKKFSYDLWGDTVNTAARLESHGENGRIHCSKLTRDLLKNQYEFTDNGLVDLKGKGEVHTYFLDGVRSEKA